MGILRCLFFNVKMKKYVIHLVLLVVLLSIVGCNSKVRKSTTVPDNKKSEQPLKESDIPETENSSADVPQSDEESSDEDNESEGDEADGTYEIMTDTGEEDDMEDDGSDEEQEHDEEYNEEDEE